MTATSEKKDEDSITVRVEYADTDAGGVAHHMSYLRWFEQARSCWLR
ncbi:MAG: tol-pal system-associated acyl-CoA thioesterase, partial [Betaproteobacteria bacterium]|nr:tol-pal system-associated acyl-CoA thioesterase [Betaproteobacteria bacterium]